MENNKKITLSGRPVKIEDLIHLEPLFHYQGRLRIPYIEDRYTKTRLTLYNYLQNEQLFEELAKALKKDYIKRGKRPKIFNQQQINEIYKLKDAGISNVKIAKQFGVNEKTIRNYLKERSDI